MGLLFMRDFVNLSVKEIEPAKKNLSECKDDSEVTGKSLLVKVEATHSGIVNGNQRFYRPDRMQDSVYRWAEPGKALKPVLVEHDKDDSAIGRIHTARYVDLSHKYREELPEIGNMLFYADAATKRLDLYRSINMVLDKLQPRDDYRGLGYIELGMKVTNPDAIRKVLSGEYLTVSVGFQTDQAICSACHTDWAADDRCEHKLGEMVDGKKMFLIAGNFFYKECSFVNFPADPFAQVISKELLSDSLNNKMFFMGMRPERQVKLLAICEMADSKDLATMYESDIQVADPDIKDSEMLAELQSYLDEMNKAPLTKERAIEISDKIKALAPKEDAEKEMVRRVNTTLKSHVQKHNLEVVVDKKITKEQVEAKIEVLIATLQDMSVEARANYIARITEEAKQFELEVPAIDVESLIPYQDWKVEDLPEADRPWFADPEALYEQMFAKADNADAIKAEDTEYGEVLADAKLSSEKRKGLKSSTFCGPGRSFPVPDCAHVTAARRLIGRAKVSDATKSKILSCVSRKAGSLGCGGKKKDSEHIANLSDSAKILLTDLHKVELFTFEDAKIPADTLSCIDTLDSHYKAADAQGQGTMRYGLYANLGYWQSMSERDYAMGRLKEIETAENKDSVKDIVLTDAETKAPLMMIGAGLKSEMGKGFVPKGVSDSYTALHKAHSAADAEGKSHIVNAAGALLEHWHSGAILEYHRKLMAPGSGQIVKDGEIVLTKIEHDTLITGQERLETQLATVKTDLDALQQQNTVLVKSLKKDRATTLVAIKVLTGEAGFQGLSDTDVQIKVKEREQRSLASLRDALDDELGKLSGFTFQSSSAALKPNEAGTKDVKDNAKLPTDTTTVIDSQAPSTRKTPLPKDPKAARAVLYFEQKTKDLTPAPTI
jgi:hypothetical protein